MAYFKLSEFECKCGCKSANVHPDLMTQLEVARKQASVPFVINSGFRCEEHNKAAGGSKSSSHLKGLACDIDVPNSTFRYLIVKALMFAGFTRLGIADTFIHVDIDQSKPKNVVWTY